MDEDIIEARQNALEDMAREFAERFIDKSWHGVVSEELINLWMSFSPRDWLRSYERIGEETNDYLLNWIE